MGVDFGALGKKKPTPIPTPVRKPSKPHVDWKKKYKSEKELREHVEAVSTEKGEKLMKISNDLNDLKKMGIVSEKDYRDLQAAFALSNENNSELQDEIEMLRQQESMSKQALDKITQEVEKYKFRPQQYSTIAQILNCLHVNANKLQKERLTDLAGGPSVYDARNKIFEILEAPYQ